MPSHEAGPGGATVRAPHGLRRLKARDPREAHRTATPLELLFDLVFAVSFAQAGIGLAGYVSEGDPARGVAGFCVEVFAIVWAWVGYTWVSSAFDTDDWLQRLLTMVQMAGVVVLALGIAPFFDSLDDPTVDNTLMVAGYIVMRVGLLVQWARVLVEVEAQRRRALTVIVWTAVAQVGWTALMLAHTSWRAFLVVGGILMVFEVLGHLLPAGARSAPWHPHHLAERFSLLVIITLGEGVVGTIATLQAVLPEQHGWTTEAVLLVVAGLGLTFGLWWSYFSVDFGRALAAVPGVSGGFTVAHILMLGGLAGIGAGLQVAGSVLGGSGTVDEATAVVTVGVPVTVFYLSLYALYSYVVPAADRRHMTLVALTLMILATALLLSRAGVSMGWCLLVVSTATVPTVVGYEWFGHAHQDRQLSSLEQD